jgi:hypothetical protein
MLAPVAACKLRHFQRQHPTRCRHADAGKENEARAPHWHACYDNHAGRIFVENVYVFRVTIMHATLAAHIFY